MILAGQGDGRTGEVESAFKIVVFAVSFGFFIGKRITFGRLRRRAGKVFSVTPVKKG